jgi:ring-1,2-phenylacetyl-CoA epoxidase subunit PaaD
VVIPASVSGRSEYQRAPHSRTDAGAAVSTVVDPELRVLTIADLGIVRDVAEDADGHVTVTITPTYSGCPAMDVIREDIRSALAAAGYPHSTVVTALRPAWTTDRISESGRAKLAAAGIAPPAAVAGAGGIVGLPMPVRGTLAVVACPRCGSTDTEELSRFGSTACKALRRCRACQEPFDQVKPL